MGSGQLKETHGCDYKSVDRRGSHIQLRQIHTASHNNNEPTAAVVVATGIVSVAKLCEEPYWLVRKDAKRV